MIDRTSYEPMYHQIKCDIEEQILDGRIKIGDKLMSEAEMIRHYQVGRVTIRNALAELVANGCLRKEQGLGTFCVALPKRGEQRNIDVMLNTVDTYFTPYFLSGIGRVLNARGYNLILHDTRDTMDSIAQILMQLLDRGTDGIILQPYTGNQKVLPECADAIRLCAERKVPLITIDGQFVGLESSCILNDDEQGCYLAAQHLIRMGHKDILGLFRNRRRDSSLRTAGFCRAIEEAGLPVRILDADTAPAEEWVRMIREEAVTGIVCYNDYLAVECYHCFDKYGIQVGKDVSVIGFDDTELSSTSIPRITTVSHPKDIMGEQAAMYLTDWIEGKTEPPYHHVFQPKLVSRESVRHNNSTR